MELKKTETSLPPAPTPATPTATAVDDSGVAAVKDELAKMRAELRSVVMRLEGPATRESVTAGTFRIGDDWNSQMQAIQSAAQRGRLASSELALEQAVEVQKLAPLSEQTPNGKRRTSVMRRPSDLDETM